MPFDLIASPHSAIYKIIVFVYQCQSPVMIAIITEKGTCKSVLHFINHQFLFNFCWLCNLFLSLCYRNHYFQYRWNTCDKCLFLSILVASFSLLRNIYIFTTQCSSHSCVMSSFSKRIVFAIKVFP